MNGGGGFYDWLLTKANEHGNKSSVAQAVQIGLVWTLCRSDAGTGLAMSTQHYSRTIAWPKPLAGSILAELAAGIRSFDLHTATVAMAAINAMINGPVNHALCEQETEGFDSPVKLAQGNLAVFDYFFPRINKGASIVVVGRYPGLERFEKAYDIKVIERHPGGNDYPDTAAEQLLPQADWVFITASSISNHTFPRLSELSRDAMVVLMGPTTPWLPELEAWGVDFLAGVQVNDEALLQQTVAEGGGRTIFDAALSYVVADIGLSRMEAVKAEISGLAKQRDALKQEMEQWYAAGNTRRFGKLAELEVIQSSLSRLDTVYKRMWDFRGS